MDALFDSAEAALGIAFPAEARAAFARYCRDLLETNQVMNLTAITEPSQVYARHFIDSAAILALGGFTGSSVIDVGCGAGFPGLPMKLVEPSLQLTLLDSLQKRIGFLQQLTARLGANDVTCMHARAEEAAHDPALRERFDWVVSRAVASLPMLCELCLPFVKLGGRMVAMKTVDCEAELAEASNALTALGGVFVCKKTYSLPGCDITHALIVIEKQESTPDKYPRRFAKMQKKPL